MSLRAGSLVGVLRELDAETLAELLEDYRVARRRDRSSRADFAAGWLAATRRFKPRQDKKEETLAA